MNVCQSSAASLLSRALEENWNFQSSPNFYLLWIIYSRLTQPHFYTFQSTPSLTREAISEAIISIPVFAKVPKHACQLIVTFIINFPAIVPHFSVCVS